MMNLFTEPMIAP